MRFVKRVKIPPINDAVYCAPGTHTFDNARAESRKSIRRGRANGPRTERFSRYETLARPLTLQGRRSLTAKGYGVIDRDNTPEGMTRRGLKRARMIQATEEIEAAVAVLGNGSRIISHDTVPFAMWCAARHLADVENAFWATASALGDIDTNCAIVGSVIAMAIGRKGIPTAWIEAREPLSWTL